MNSLKLTAYRRAEIIESRKYLSKLLSLSSRAGNGLKRCCLRTYPDTENTVTVSLFRDFNTYTCQVIVKSTMIYRKLRNARRLLLLHFPSDTQTIYW
jgi:hypothetical protein